MAVKGDDNRTGSILSSYNTQIVNMKEPSYSGTLKGGTITNEMLGVGDVGNSLTMMNQQQQQESVPSQDKKLNAK